MIIKSCMHSSENDSINRIGRLKTVDQVSSVEKLCAVDLVIAKKITTAVNLNLYRKRK